MLSTLTCSGGRQTRFRYLGNGTSACDKDGMGDVAPYFNWEAFQKVYTGYSETVAVVE